MIVPVALGVIGIAALLLKPSASSTPSAPFVPPPMPGPTPGPRPGPAVVTVPFETVQVYMGKLRQMGYTAPVGVGDSTHPEVQAAVRNFQSTDPSLRQDGMLDGTTMRAIDVGYQQVLDELKKAPLPPDYMPDSPPSPFEEYQGQEQRLRERPIYW